MAALLLAVLGGIAAQGHASVDAFSGLQVGAQLVHIVAVAVWISGPRAGRAGPTSGCRPSRRRAAPRSRPGVLARFSRVALIAVGLAVLTGVVRSLGELDDPAELWETAYGRSILFKVALLIPIAALALYNRRIAGGAAARAAARTCPRCGWCGGWRRRSSRCRWPSS